jgi:hypothetical protein
MRDPIVGTWVERARALPIEAGLLGRTVIWKRGDRGVERCGPCLKCGGDDRFSIHTTKGLWNCRGCGCGGKGAISLAMHVASVDFYGAVELLTGEPRPQGALELPDTPERIIAGLVPVIGSPGEQYLAERRWINITAVRDALERKDVIGWHPAVYLNEPGDLQHGIPVHPLHGQRLGCIVGIMTDPITGRPTGAISRTYLDADLQKIGKAKTLGKPQDIIRLSRDEDVHEGLFLTEGLETALTAMAIGLRPVWATGTTGVMKRFPVLPGIEALTIIADHDHNGAGERAAREVANRWREAGREVHILLPTAFGDLNDLIRARAA